MSKLKKNKHQTGFATLKGLEKNVPVKLPEITRQQLQQAIRGLEQHGVRDYVVKIWKY